MVRIVNFLNPILWWRYIILIKASSLVERRKYNKAKNILKNLLRKGSVSEYHYYLLGKIYLQDKDYDTAKECFEHSIQYNHSENIYKANTYFYLGLTYYESEDFENAVFNFEKAIKIKHVYRLFKNSVVTLSDLYCYLGRSYVKLNRIDTAFKTFNKGLQYEPNNESLQRELTLLGLG